MKFENYTTAKPLESGIDYSQYLRNQKLDEDYFNPDNYIDPTFSYENIKNNFEGIGWDTFSVVLQKIKLRIETIEGSDFESSHELKKRLEFIVSDYDSLLQKIESIKGLFNKMNIVLVGDKDKILPGLQRLGYDIVELDADGNPITQQ